MVRTIGKLTALPVSQAKLRGYYGDGGGLFLQVSAGGAKSWVFRFNVAGRARASYAIRRSERKAADRIRVRPCRA